ncbi:MAG: glycogen/starch synthase [Kiritimatiellales bacterium]
MSTLRVLMVAAENDGIANCKVGGIADVIRDIPAALTKEGCCVSVVTPSYGYLHEAAGAVKMADIRFYFAGQFETATLYRVRPKSDAFNQSGHFVIDHPGFLHRNSAGQPVIYSDDPPSRPFCTDATKFARFCTAAATAVNETLCGELNILHLHDWHAAFLLILRKYSSEFAALQNLRTVYTIHNLALQGIRPVAGDLSSLRHWFPGLFPGDRIPAELLDPRWTDCINPMAIGIRLADAVHAVSPTYAEEILRPGNPPQFSGGEGLEKELQHAAGAGKLFGILNGCDYPPEHKTGKLKAGRLFELLKRETAHIAAQRGAVNLADVTALQTLEKIITAKKKPAFIATGISRAVDQKMLLLKARGTDGKTGLEKILSAIGSSGVYILIGSGDQSIEAFLAETAALNSNFIFINGYAAKAAEALYASGDLFIMPSSFEPCGIGQMLAMRAGQPCLVHRTGGLRDTVQPGITGFSFKGETLVAQVDAMQTAFSDALALRAGNPEEWNSVCTAAAAARFLWSDSAKQYIEKLYSKR